jgi:hypothetical protein
VEFVGKGDFGLASGHQSGGTYDRVWFQQPVSPDEVAFESGVFLLTKAKTKAIKDALVPGPGLEPGPSPGPTPGPEPEPGPAPGPQPGPGVQTKTLRVVGTIPPEIWNRLGTKIIPKLKSGSDLKIGVDFSIVVDIANAKTLEADLRQVLQDLGLVDKVRIE